MAILSRSQSIGDGVGTCRGRRERRHKLLSVGIALMDAGIGVVDSKPGGVGDDEIIAAEGQLLSRPDAQLGKRLGDERIRRVVGSLETSMGECVGSWQREKRARGQQEEREKS